MFTVTGSEPVFRTRMVYSPASPGLTSKALGMGVTEMEAARPSAETTGAASGSRALHMTRTRKMAVRREAATALAVGIMACARRSPIKTLCSPCFTKRRWSSVHEGAGWSTTIHTRLNLVRFTSVESIAVVASTARWTTYHGRGDGFTARPTHRRRRGRRSTHSGCRSHRTNNGSTHHHCLSLG